MTSWNQNVNIMLFMFCSMLYFCYYSFYSKRSLNIANLSCAQFCPHFYSYFVLLFFFQFRPWLRFIHDEFRFFFLFQSRRWKWCSRCWLRRRRLDKEQEKSLTFERLHVKWIMQFTVFQCFLSFLSLALSLSFLSFLSFSFPFCVLWMFAMTLSQSLFLHTGFIQAQIFFFTLLSGKRKRKKYM